MDVYYTRIMYSGHVQGVGFRYQTREIATGYEVCGYVRNTVDGRVELEVEGEKDEVNDFTSELAEHMAGYIHSSESAEGFRSALHKGFTIVH